MLPKIDYDLKTFRGDLFGGVTAAVVGLPVSLAFGVARRVWEQSPGSTALSR